MTTIKIQKDGPYIVSGECELTDTQGDRIPAKDPFALCRCGHSAKKPFCDGSHKSHGFSDES